MNKGKFYITTAIVYTSGKPHIGNAYDPVLADAIARYKKEEGYEVFFMTGTDEHGQKIEEKAKEKNISPKQYVDNTAKIVKDTYDLLNIKYDRFIRTTDPDHVNACQKIFEKLYNQGDIYKGNYEGWYCTPCESFFTDSQLVDGKCPDCGREVYKAKEEAYFFKMSKYVDRLIEYYNSNDFIFPISKKNEMMNNFLLTGLKDLCVSRTSFTWGIKVPFDEKHVIYVWLDALMNYITGIGYDVDNEKENFKKFWPCDLHVIGKDIVRFHTIYWPIFLMALDLPLPKKVFGHPWLLSGTKMSKSLGNVLYPDELVNIFGVDGVRFYLLHEMPYETDGNVDLEYFTEKYNVDLANNLGNLVSRVHAMIKKYHSGKVEKLNDEVNNEVDSDLKKSILNYVNECKLSFEKLHVADAVDSAFDIFRRCNKYIDETTPWVICKNEEDANRLKTVMYNLVVGICIGAKLIYSFMPDTSKEILYMFNCEDIEFNDLDKFSIKKESFYINEKSKNLFDRKDINDVLEHFKKNN